MRLKELEGELQPLYGFDGPDGSSSSKRELEQFVTSAHLASRMIFTAQSSFGDIEGKRVLDLGCGCGILGIASVMMGASSVVGIDIDSDALEVARTNIELVEMEEEEIELVNARVELPGSEELGGEVPIFIPKNYGEFETVVLNPPFGTQVKGIDMAFLEVACSVAQNSIYSLHKTSTREFILKKCLTWGFKGEVLAEMKYDLPKTMKIHKFKTIDIQVDFIRFERISPLE